MEMLCAFRRGKRPARLAPAYGPTVRADVVAGWPGPHSGASMNLQQLRARVKRGFGAERLDLFEWDCPILIGRTEVRNKIRER